MKVQNLTPSAASKVLNYTGSLNGSIGDVLPSTGTPDSTWYNFDVDYNPTAGKAAFIGFDGTNWKHIIGTYNSGTSDITWGTGLTVSGMGSNPRPAVCMISATLSAVGYNDNEGTPNFEVKTFSVSTNTPTLDQTSNIATINTSGPNGVALSLQSSGRMIGFYPNTSGYPTVIGINASAGSLTKDASATVINSNATINEGKTIRKIGTSKALATYDRTAGRYDAIITDGGTTTSAGTPRQLSVTAGNAGIIAGAAGAISFCSAFASDSLSKNALGLSQIASGAISAEFVYSANSRYILLPMHPPSGFSNFATSFGNSYLGDVDNDSTVWGVIPVTAGDATGKIHGLFIGFKATGGTPEKSIIQVLKELTTSATNRAAGAYKIVAVDTTTFILFYIDDTNADYKYLVCKL